MQKYSFHIRPLFNLADTLYRYQGISCLHIPIPKKRHFSLKPNVEQGERESHFVSMYLICMLVSVYDKDM